TLARRALRIDAVQATVAAPGQVAAGAKFSVKWTGPNNDRDYIAIGNASRPYLGYEYTKAGSPLDLTAPDEPGQYEVRYFLGAGDVLIGKKPIVVGSVSASVSVPQTVAAGSNFKITWRGPKNPRDYVTIVKAGTPDGQNSRDLFKRIDQGPAQSGCGQYRRRELAGPEQRSRLRDDREEGRARR